MSDTLKDRLKSLRKSLGLRQKEMADRMDIPASTYRKWEYGTQIPNKVAIVEIDNRITKIAKDLSREACIRAVRSIFNSNSK